MRIDEVEVGDIVSAHCRIACIAGVFEDRIYTMRGQDFLSGSVYPVLLDDSVFESNGMFEPVANAWVIVDNDNRSVGQVEHVDGVYRVAMSLTGYELIVDIRYVHELQHILRFCKLYDLADSIAVKC